MVVNIEENLEKGILLSPDYNELTLSSPTQKIKQSKEKSKVIIVESHEDINQKKNFKDFVVLYNNRYKQIQNILKNRQELQGIISIGKVNTLQENESVSCIGMILDLNKTKNNNYVLTLEDKTGSCKIIITKNNENFDLAKDLTPDEVIGITGTKGKGVVFANSIILPDVPLNKELKKSPEKEAVLFISDVHVGAKQFLSKSFERLIEWLNGKVGTEEQKEQVKKIKYLFLIGDLVEGIGIFPGQEKDLENKDIFEQYKIFSNYIKQIPERIKIIISPGNHDYVRIAEPQPPVPKEVLPDLYEKPNIYFVSSPSLVNIGSTEDFSGFDILLYHGFSFPYYANNIESIRFSGGLESTEKIMAYLLKKRHLAPTHGSTQMQMGFTEDPLVIKKVPDFFVSGHIHRATVNKYRNVTLLNCSCWMSQTDYQEKRGLVPEPARAIYVELDTRKTKILNFEK